MSKNERSLKTEAVVLRHSDWGEADRLLTLYTRQKGKLRAIAKGVRKINSRKAGHLEPFTLSNLLLAAGRDFWIVTQAEMVDSFSRIRENLELTGDTAYIVELIDQFTYEAQENRDLYQLLVDTLKRLSSGEEIFLTTRYFEMRLFDHLGYRPQLFTCVNCGKEIQAEDQFFSAEKGGIICPSCGKQIPNLTRISVDALRFLRHYQRSSFNDAKRAKIPAPIRQEMETVLRENITYYLERGLKTPAFIKAIK
jgi:DNA repair protein RecO (recombination protein O)